MCSKILSNGGGSIHCIFSPFRMINNKVFTKVKQMHKQLKSSIFLGAQSRILHTQRCPHLSLRHHAAIWANCAAYLSLYSVFVVFAIFKSNDTYMLITRNLVVYKILQMAISWFDVIIILECQWHQISMHLVGWRLIWTLNSIMFNYHTLLACTL